jgi:hypothetical protein
MLSKSIDDYLAHRGERPVRPRTQGLSLAIFRSIPLMPASQFSRAKGI